MILILKKKLLHHHKRHCTGATYETSKNSQCNGLYKPVYRKTDSVNKHISSKWWRNNKLCGQMSTVVLSGPLWYKQQTAQGYNYLRMNMTLVTQMLACSYK